MPQSRHGDILSHYANVDFEQKLTSNNFEGASKRFDSEGYHTTSQIPFLNFTRIERYIEIK